MHWSANYNEKYENLMDEAKEMKKMKVTQYNLDQEIPEEIQNLYNQFLNNETIVAHVFSFLSHLDLKIMARVNSGFNKVSEKDRLWKKHIDLVYPKFVYPQELLKLFPPNDSGYSTLKRVFDLIPKAHCFQCGIRITIENLFTVLSRPQTESDRMYFCKPCCESVCCFISKGDSKEYYGLTQHALLNEICLKKRAHEYSLRRIKEISYYWYGPESITLTRIRSDDSARAQRELEIQNEFSAKQVSPAIVPLISMYSNVRNYVSGWTLKTASQVVQDVIDRVLERAWNKKVGFDTLKPVQPKVASNFNWGRIGDVDAFLEKMSNEMYAEKDKNMKMCVVNFIQSNLNMELQDILKISPSYHHEMIRVEFFRIHTGNTPIKNRKSKTLEYKEEYPAKFQKNE